MVLAAEDAGIKAQMTFNFRFFPAIARARQLVEEGFLGRIFSFSGRYHRASYIDPAKPLSWRLQKGQSGAGALFDLGSHVLDLVRYLLGEFDAVQASLETSIPERPLSAGSRETGPVDVDDLALLQVRMAQGALGAIEASRVGTGATNDLKIEIFGDAGALRFDLDNPSWLEVYDVRDPVQPMGGMRGFRKVETVQRYTGQKSPDWTMAPGFSRSHAECQYQFLKAIWEDRQPAPNLADGLRVQEAMEAAIVSSEMGRWVSIKEVTGTGWA
jgi:predicted dehydrogenase